MTLNGKEILPIEAMIHIDKIELGDNVFEAWGFDAITGEYDHIVHVLASGNWTILGRPSEISEEVARELVDNIFERHYRDYQLPESHHAYGGPYVFDNPIDSLISWCKANGITDKHILLIKTP